MWLRVLFVMLIRAQCAKEFKERKEKKTFIHEGMLLKEYDGKHTYFEKQCRNTSVEVYFHK